MIENEGVRLSHNETLKADSPDLAGTLAKTLAETTVDHFSEDDTQFLKFHGSYQQDNRDQRKTGKQYIFMVRTRIPGGVLGSGQYLVLDRLASEFANQTLRITSRQGIQFHGLLKSNLRKTIRYVNAAMVTTLAACGDVVRNVMAPPTPAIHPMAGLVLEHSRHLSSALLPATSAYHEIWINGEAATPTEKPAKDFVDPLYGRTYLPRKFKIGFAIPPLNDVDVFTQCLGLVAIGDRQQLLGYNLLAGGGMGRSHGNVETFPRLADVIGFFTPDKLEAVAKAVVGVHRDFGDRVNRKHARLKYVLEQRGADWFRGEVERRIGSPLEPARPFKFERQGDRYGWRQQLDGRWFLGLYVETGRIMDAPGHALKTALRQIAEQFQPEIRLTPSQNVLLANIPTEHKSDITKLLAQHGIPVENQASAVRLASMTCVALPTCGLALAESERVFPDVLQRIEALLNEVGLKHEGIIIRLTGCPNGCVRPYLAEIGLVGKAPNKYQLYLGGNESSTRLNRLYKESVALPALVDELRPILTQYVAGRQAHERFGDWCERVLWKAAPPTAT